MKKLLEMFFFGKNGEASSEMSIPRRRSLVFTCTVYIGESERGHWWLLARRISEALSLVGAKHSEKLFSFNMFL